MYLGIFLAGKIPLITCCKCNQLAHRITDRKTIRPRVNFQASGTIAGAIPTSKQHRSPAIPPSPDHTEATPARNVRSFQPSELVPVPALDAGLQGNYPFQPVAYPACVLRSRIECRNGQVADIRTKTDRLTEATSSFSCNEAEDISSGPATKTVVYPFAGSTRSEAMMIVMERAQTQISRPFPFERRVMADHLYQIDPFLE